MARCSMLLALIAVGASVAAARGLSSGRAFLGAGMQPEVVARTLKNVEDEWKAQAGLFAQCSSAGSDRISLVNCADAPASFAKSCGIVVSAVIQGSAGDKTVAKEYMSDVCNQNAIKGWHQQKCNGLAVAISGAMSADVYENRYHFNSEKLCGSFWSKFLKEEEQRINEEKAAREAAEKKAAEEEKAAEEAAVKRAAEEAERKKIAEAAREKEEAQAKAKEAAALAAQKKAEAAAVAEAAERKLAEAKQAERDHAKAVEKVEATKAKPAPAKTEPKPVAANAVPVQDTAVKPAAAKAAAPVVVAKAAPAKVAAPVQAKAAEAPANVKAAPVKAAEAKSAKPVVAPVEAKAPVATKK